MNIDYSKIIADNYNLYITDERLNELKALAKEERDFLMRKNYFYNYSTMLSNRAVAIAYTNSKYSKLSTAERAILANNIVFDDMKFIEILKKGNFNLECLETFIKLVNYFKYKSNNNTIADSDQKYINTINIYAQKLLVHFAKFVGQIDINIIINKLNEVLSYKYDLLKENKHTR